ncbi:MAG: cell wall-binding repeat-containing protein, partial [Romboutsia timonensis]
MLKRKKEIIAKVMATTMLASTLTSTFTTNVSAAEPQTKATVSETTIAGDDRYKTAVEISKNYSSTSKHAVIVNGQKGIVDALTATPYASLKKAPILMTQSTKLNADTKKELTRRGVKTVDIVGGVNSVSDAVKAEIEAMGITVNRIAGNSKYETSLEVAKRIDAISDVSKIAVANGEVLADAVSVAAPAAQNKMPIILAHPTNGLDAK